MLNWMVSPSCKRLMAKTRLVSPGPGVRLLVVFTTIVFAGAVAARMSRDVSTTLDKVFIASAFWECAHRSTTSPAVWQVKYIHGLPFGPIQRHRFNSWLGDRNSDYPLSRN